MSEIITPAAETSSAITLQSESAICVSPIIENATHNAGINGEQLLATPARLAAPV